jgi:hypothetical protein
MVKVVLAQDAASRQPTRVADLKVGSLYQCGRDEKKIYFRTQDGLINFEGCTYSPQAMLYDVIEVEGVLTISSKALS